MFNFHSIETLKYLIYILYILFILFIYLFLNYKLYKLKKNKQNLHYIFINHSIFFIIYPTAHLIILKYQEQNNFFSPNHPSIQLIHFYKINKYII
jgi:hypothetical protein